MSKSSRYGRRYTDEEKQKALEMILSEVPFSQIREKLGCSGAVLTKWSRDAGIKSRHPRPVRHAASVRKRADKMFDKGMAAADVAKKLDIPRKTAWYWKSQRSV